MPKAARNSARAAKNPTQTAWKRGCATAADSLASIVIRSSRLAFGLAAATASRRNGTTATGSPDVRTATTELNDDMPASIPACSSWCSGMYASACDPVMASPE